jgi:hypothetical protein
VLLHVYITGHGYMNQLGQSFILLNQPIHFLPVDKKDFDRETTQFMNPYPLEIELANIFEAF